MHLLRTPKFFITALLSGIFITLAAFDDGEGGSSDEELLAGYEARPPLVKAYSVRKLSTLQADSSNLEMCIEYWTDSARPAMPAVLPVYAGAADFPVLFYDNGTHGDSAAGDRRYCGRFREDIDAFINQVQAAEAELATGRVMHFTGHSGSDKPYDDPFNLQGFQTGQPVPISPRLIDPVACGTDLLKQNSLFITDLSVVEDPARTYNVYTGMGNPSGAWTFGTLMQAAANPYGGNGIPVKDFLKAWVAHWTTTQTMTIPAGNGLPASVQTVPHRNDVIRFLIRPWLLKCDPNIEAPGGTCGGPIDLASWSCKWDRASVQPADLVKYAPFKLTAIVNRIDLVGNMAYQAGLLDAGETRFIYTLIDPTTGRVPDAENPPHIERSQASPLTPAIDWSGMNVILEYRNVWTSKCDLRDFIQAWLDLSSYPLPANPATPNTAFNDALEAITTTVTAAGSLPGAPNNSALARIRTNERCFMGNGQGAPGNQLFLDWNNRNWEFRQFETHPFTHLPVQTPLFNTPPSGANLMYFTEGTAFVGGSPVGASIVTWVLAHAAQVVAGTHALPVQLLAAAGTVDGEWTHYFDFDWSRPTYPASYRDLRHQYSLQTCQGCHNGETKTPFTHVQVRGYGQPANYWRAVGPGSSPDHFTGLIETFTSPKENIGVTQLPGGGTVKNLPLPTGIRTLPVVSAFLTGRNYGGLIGGPDDCEDDVVGSDNSATGPYPEEASMPDNGIEGYFFVNDPINSWAGPANNPALTDDRKNRYNDLEFRKQRMCQLLNSLCKPRPSPLLEAPGQPLVFPIMMFTSMVPFPDGAH